MQTITDAYEAFSDLHGTERPLWTRERLRDAIHEHGWRYEDITPERLSLLVDEELGE